jgi:hypothetical protein
MVKTGAALGKVAVPEVQIFLISKDHVPEEFSP